MHSFIRNFLCALAVILCTTQTAISTEVSATITTVTGEQFAGAITSWSATGITVETGEETQQIAREQLLRVTWKQDAKDKQAQTYLVLVDETILPLSTFEVTDRQAVIITPLSSSQLSIPTERIHLVQFSCHSDAATELQQKLDDDLVGDVLVIQKKNSTESPVVLDYLSGLIGDVSVKKVDFNWEGELIPVKRSKIAALAFYHARPPQLPEAVCVLTTQSGARLPATQVTQVGERIQLTTRCGLELEIPLQSLREADYSAGKLIYLSDLQPTRQKWTPSIGLPASAELISHHGQPRRDQSFSGSTLFLAWPETEAGTGRSELKTYSKGLALRSRTDLRYRIPAEMKRFICIAGIDPTTARVGHVILTLFADEQVIWQGEIAGGAAPVEIEVELGAAKELRIFVDYGANLDFGDRVHLAEARVSK